MAKKAKRSAPKPKEEITLKYECHDGSEHEATLKVPVSNASAHAFLNEAERRGAKGIPGLRAQIAKHY